jgi:hypothetical protein
MDVTKVIIQYLPFIIPFVLLQYALLAAALVHILRHKNYKRGNRVLWIIVVVIVNIIGPVLYFTLGRSDE